jgi:murein DD-endopeptidase MepM/ murein hydrolase activator NlpD
VRSQAARRTAGGCFLTAILALTTALSSAPASATDPSSTASPSPSPSPSATATATATATTKASERTAKERRAREKARAAEEEARAAEREAARRKAEKSAAAAKKAAELAAEQAHDAAELVAASQALAKAQADLVVAREALTEAELQLESARALDAAAQTDLDAAVLAEERAARELAEVEARILTFQDDLGRLASTAYQSNGTMGELAVVLSAATPGQLADRLEFLQSVGSAGNAVIARLSAARAELVNAESRLSAARERAELKRVEAAAALQAVQAKEMLAKAAERQLDAVVETRKAAFEEAKRAALEDRRRYRVMVTESGALASRIVSASSDLADGPRPPKGTGKFVLPGTGTVTSEYGPRLHPILNYVKVHTGTDFGAGDGIAYAADRGVVLFTEFNVAYGNMTIIDHGKVGGVRISTLYAHQSAIGVEPGDRVIKGQAIGVIGSTGYSTGPHLHFEVRVNGNPVDPLKYL